MVPSFIWFVRGGDRTTPLLRYAVRSDRPLSDHMIFHEHRQFSGGQPQLAAQDFSVMLADQWRSPRDAPRRDVIDCRFAGIGEAATEFRMLDLFPETAIVQMRVVEQLLWRTDRTPGETALLRAVIDLLGRQAGDKVGD